MQLKEIMTKEVQTISSEATLQQAAMIMLTHKVGILPVVKDNRPIGVITDRDITVRATSLGLDSTHTYVAKAMTPKIFSLSEESSLREAIELMKREQIRRVLVCDASGRLLGLFSSADLNPLYKNGKRAILPTSYDFALAWANRRDINRRISSKARSPQLVRNR